jgi:polar amino acid transport system substrate-binding protein
MPCLGTIAALAGGLMLASAETVVIGTDGPFPSYVLVDEAGTISGFERDVMDEVCLRAALVCDWELANFDQLIPGVMSGQFDIVLGGMAVTEARQKLVDFTTPYHGTDPEEWYIGRPGAPAPDLARIGVQSGTVHEAHLRGLGLAHVSFATEPEVLAALLAGQVDLALGPYQTRSDIGAFLIEHGFDYLYSEMIPDDGVAMAVCKGNDALLNALNLALADMRADGTLETYEIRWFN